LFSLGRMQRGDGGWMTVRAVYACCLLFLIIYNH